MQERRNTRARHREHTEQRGRIPIISNRLHQSSNQHYDQDSSSSHDNAGNNALRAILHDMNATLAHAHDHVARSGRDISRSVHFSDQLSPLPSGRTQPIFFHRIWKCLNILFARIN